MPIAVPNPNQTYNPRDNSPIKMPEIETCITCGQTLPSKVKPMTNEMSQYLNGDDKKSILVVASNEDTLDMKGVTFYRIAKYNHEGKPILAVDLKKKTEPTPIVSTPPVEEKK